MLIPKLLSLKPVMLSQLCLPIAISLSLLLCSGWPEWPNPAYCAWKPARTEDPGLTVIVFLTVNELSFALAAHVIFYWLCCRLAFFYPSLEFQLLCEYSQTRIAVWFLFEKKWCASAAFVFVYCLFWIVLLQAVDFAGDNCLFLNRSWASKSKWKHEVFWIYHGQRKRSQ